MDIVLMTASASPGGPDNHGSLQRPLKSVAHQDPFEALKAKAW